jgi:hypothetical protein
VLITIYGVVTVERWTYKKSEMTIKACAEEDEEPSHFVLIDTELYSDLAIMDKKQGWDNATEFIIRILKLGIKLDQF